MRRLALLLLCAPLLASCDTREVEKDLQIVNVKTGWYDAGVVSGQNKLVPSISLELKNVSQEEISSVQLNAVFRRTGEEQSWGDHFVRAIDTAGLAAGANTMPIVMRSSFGYTGSQARVQMLQNREFVDATVQVFGKHGRRNWVKMGEYPVGRNLLAQ